MIKRYTHHGLTWIDLESPSREEIVLISEEFSLPSLVGEEMFASTLRSKVDLYDNFMYLILHFPVVHPERINALDQSDQEIDFIVGKNFFISVRYEPVGSLQQFAAQFESVGIREKVQNHAGFLFTTMMKHLYADSLHELEHITKIIYDIELRIFNDQEQAMVKRISHTNRRLLHFRQALRFHGDILRSYESASKKFFGEEYNYYAILITSEFNKVNSVLESHHDVLRELQHTNDSLLSAKSNTIIQTLTILSLIILPLTLIAGIFAMHTEFSFIKKPADFFMIIAAMGCISLILLIIFKIKKWI